MTLWRMLLGLAMVCAASVSSSLTLGVVRGTVLFGQPLNIGIQMTVDGTEDARSLCVAAEVFNGDARMDPSRVTVSMDAPDANGNTVARIRSSAVVDEAFVAVNLKAGCSQVSSRRYVMLTDVPVEPAAAPVSEPVAQVVAPAAPTTAQQGAPVSDRSATGAAADSSTARSAVAPGPSRLASRQPNSRPQSSGPVKQVEPKPGRTVAQPRLKLDSVQPLAGIDQNLRKSTELATMPAATPEKSAEAALLWRTLNSEPQDILKQTQRLQGLEAEFKAFRELTNKNQAELAAQLKIAAQQQDKSMYLYILSGLLALAMVLVAALWWNLRRRVEAQREWWQDRGETAPLARRGVDLAADPRDDASPVGSASTLAPSPSLVGSKQASGGDSLEGANDVRDSNQLRSIVESTSEAAPRQEKSAQYEELFDVQQQADFFLSLGQTDQAVALLNNHIRSSEETSPLAYLELLRIYHSTGRAKEYDALRTSFMRVFNANVPDFHSYGEETRDLESYRGIVPSIQASWGTSKAEKMLDEMMFRRPGSKWDHAFELTAYAELCLLHGIAKEVSASPVVERNSVSVFGVLPTGSGPGTAPASYKAANALGLDLDLGGDPESVASAPAIVLARPNPEFSEDTPTRPAQLGS